MTASLSAIICLNVLADVGTAVAAGGTVTRALAPATTRAVPGPSSRPARAAGGVAGAALLGLALAGRLPIVVAVVAAVAVAVVPFAIGRAGAALTAGLVVAGSVGGVLAAGDVPRMALGVLAELGAALWLGAAGMLAGDAGHRARAAGLAGGLVLTAAWCAGLVLGHISPVPDPGWATVLATARGTLTAVCLVWLVSALRGYSVPRRPQLAAVAGVVALGAVGAAVRPVAPPVIGAPMLASVSVAGRPVSVMVAPGRPGWNLVHLGSGATSVGTDPARTVTAAALPGAGNSWAQIRLPAGRSRLWVGGSGRGGWLTIDTGTKRRAADLRGPDGPECASLALGRLLSARTEPLLSCPADALGEADADALRATVRFIAGRTNSVIGLVTDGSPRSTAAAAVVRAEAARRHLTTAPVAAGRPLLVLAGWGPAAAAVRDVATGSTRAEGVYLAPWLLDTPLLSEPAGQLLPLRFDPRDAGPHGYLTALGTRFPGEPPSAAGYEGWRGRGFGDAPVRLYAASRVFVPGGPLLSEHQHHSAVTAAAWLPDGTVIAVTPPWAAV